MRTHNFAEGLCEQHPVIADFGEYLAKRGLDCDTTDFLTRHSYFVYPRTLWIKLAVNINHRKAEQDIRARHRLQPNEIGKAIGDWVTAKPAINKVVFDLTEVTIFDGNQIRDLFVATLAEQGGSNYCVCNFELADTLRAMAGVDPSSLFHSEREILNHLRDVPRSRKCVVKLPKIVDLAALEEALLTDASEEKLRDRDAIVFDMTDVIELSFDANSMFAPVIHSLAHSHGILAEVSVARGELRSKVVRDVVEHGSLRPMRSNLIHTHQEILKRQDFPDTAQGILPMHTFSKDESGQIQKLCFQWLEKTFTYYFLWMTDIIRVPVSEFAGLTAEMAEDKLAGRKIEQLTEIRWELWDIIQELVDNVAGHAHGLGYVMLELDPQPGKGLNIYVGDTGIGLAHGLENSYQMGRPTHCAAAAMAMSLAEKLDERRQLHGTLKHGGRGLEHVKILLRQYSGTIRIRTGDSEATFSFRKRVRTFSNMFNLQGTHIYVFIPGKWKAL